MYFLMVLIVILFALGAIIVEHGIKNLVRKIPSDRILQKRNIPPEKFKAYATLRGVSMIVAGIGAMLYISIFLAFYTYITMILIFLGFLMIIYGLVVAIILKVTYKKKPKSDPL